MSLLSSIAEVKVKMREQVGWFDAITTSVYFLNKKLASKIASAIRADGGDTGWWVINTDSDLSKSTYNVEPIGKIDEAFIVLKSDTNFGLLNRVLNTFNLAIVDETELNNAIESSENTNGTTFIGFYSSIFNTEKFSSEKDDLKKIEIEVFNKTSIVSGMMKQIFPIDAFLTDISIKENNEALADVPENINGYILTDDMRLSWPAIKAVLEDGYDGMIRFMAHGIAGSGKTDFARALAYYFGSELVEVDCSIIVEPNQWFYRRGVKNGQTYDELTPLAKALTDNTREPLIVLLDEVSRNNPMVLNPLMQMLGEQRNITLGNETFNFVRPVLFYLTCNIGSQYTGTDLMDLALLSRMDIVIEQKPPKRELLQEIAMAKYSDVIEEKVIEKIVKCIYESMMYTVENEIPELVTIREMLNVLRQVMLGLNVRAAMKLGVISKQSEHNRSHIEAIINNIIL